MDALLVERLSRDLSGVRLTEMPTPPRNKGEVLVGVRAASLNYPDLLMTRGDYQFKPEPPFVAGMELAGEVIEADEHGRWSVGDRVMGGNKIGAFADFASVPEAALVPIPQRVDFPTAAAMGTAYMTAYVALVEFGGIEAGQWVLVHGAGGGVGLAACDLARALGARVIAATHDIAKADLIRAACAPEAIIVNRGRFREEVSELTGGHLCDLVLDPIGGDVFDESTRCVAFGGKLLVVGFVAGRISQIALNIPLMKAFSIVGVRAGEYARRFPERGERVAGEIGRLASEGRITPMIDRVVPLANWREGFDAMVAGELVGKVVLKPGG